MAADMINEVLKAENLARKKEEEAKKQAENILEKARIKADDIREIIADQARGEVRLIITEAEDTAEGIIKQAQTLAHLRERKVISETEKKYDESIKAVIAGLF